MKDRQEKLFDAITLIEEEVIDDADRFCELEGELVKQRWKARIRWRIIVVLVLLAGLACLMLFLDSGERNTATGFEETDVFDGSAPILQSGLYPTRPESMDISVHDTRFFPSGKVPDEIALINGDPVNKLSVYRSMTAGSTDDSYRLLLTWAEYLKTRVKEEFDLDLSYDPNDVKIGNQPYDSANPVLLEPFPVYDMELDLLCGGTTVELVCLQDETVTSFHIMQGIEDLYIQWSGEKSVQLPTDSTDEEILQTVVPVMAFTDRMLGTRFHGVDPKIKRTQENDLRIHYYMDQINGSEISRELMRREKPKNDSATFAFERSSDGYTFYLQGIGISKEYLNYIGEYELISREVAEKRLAEGFCFGRGLYPIYDFDKEKELFSDYDFVRIEYPSSHCEYVVPYYAFYKCVGQKRFDSADDRFQETGGLADEYAVVYVPAVTLESPKEY